MQTFVLLFQGIRKKKKFICSLPEFQNLSNYCTQVENYGISLLRFGTLVIKKDIARLFNLQGHLTEQGLLPDKQSFHFSRSIANAFTVIAERVCQAFDISQAFHASSQVEGLWISGEFFISPTTFPSVSILMTSIYSF